ncbi:iron complex transport system ATP-binding protein [Roseovarius halotolerans]|uniref:Iron(3+)-hydroxamate import ATP-binding protein FhuC n=1 Tax=Roseovarius halotolerans TaxID=505353 RepID=A0A1X6Y9P6_9RHOB|nr:ABC transporter ATP-binding protein [Roseovarius halotolerans]RKT35033.1 iron complex transport system ATP-binding protein [Roseovarius halotolerans]SLN14799.1 Iron(3+)-hydroxamate import ATP-binding protein FhuC [Roseovarius halotolerans]
MSLLTLSNLSVTLRTRAVLRDVSLDIGEGEFVGLIGPNGAGKTTLMRAALGLLPFSGESSLTALPQHERARIAAWMPQSREIAWPISVETLVLLGRIPHLGAFGDPSPEDRARVDAALDWMGLDAMRHRAASRLSGGEQARALIARALAQDTPLLMADEPIAGLDPAHQISTMRTFAQLAEAGKSALVSLHDLGMAARHCTRLVMLSEGRLVADGPPAEVLTPERLADVFAITAWYQHTDQGTVYQPLEVLR